MSKTVIKMLTKQRTRFDINNELTLNLILKLTMILIFKQLIINLMLNSMNENWRTFRR